MNSRAERTIIIDFETRSGSPLSQAGAYKYASDPTTDYLCLGYKFPGKKARLLKAREPFPKKIIKALDDGYFLEAHSAQFDRQIWNKVLVRDHPHVPILPISRWYCSQARVAYAGLPLSLKNAAMTLGLTEQKMDEGKSYINTLSRPKSWNDFGQPVFSESPSALRGMFEYCLQDIETTAALCKVIPDLPDFEREVYIWDQTINDHGIHIDRDLCLKAVKIIAKLDKYSMDEFVRITGIDSPTKRGKARDWLERQGLDIPNTQKDTIAYTLKLPGVDPELKTVLKMITSAGKSSIKKYIAAINMLMDDQRIRGSLLYYGAHTGRFAGRGFQPHNFPRTPPEDAMEVACNDVKTLDIDILSLMYEDPRDLLSSCVRGMVTPDDGHYFYCGDLKSIEAIVLFWVAGEKKALEVFASGKDIYCVFASYIFGRKITAADEFERFMGKQSVLGLGYGMGVAKFIQTLRNKGAVMSYENCVKIFKTRNALEEAIDAEYKIFLTGQYGAFFKKQIEAFHIGPIKEIIHEIAAARKIVGLYRKKYAKVPALWKNEEANAMDSVRGPKKHGQWCRSTKGKNVWLRRQLPAGRMISYYNPQLVKKKNPATGKTGTQLMYSSRVGDSSKSFMNGTFGGKIVENVIQAISRDVLVSLFDALGKANFKIAFTVHDEVIVESASPDRLKQFTRIMTQSPQWAKDLPVMVSAKRLTRYEK